MTYVDRWEAHYQAGGGSGPGSVGRHAEWKAGVVNQVVRVEAIQSVLEFGCGDGQQLALYDVPAYVGLDVSPTAVQLCRARFDGDPSKTFRRYTPGLLRAHPRAELTLAVETLMHVVDDDAFRLTVDDLFGYASRYVLICDPLTELEPWDGPGWVRMRDLRPVLEAYGDFVVADYWFHPDVTEDDRARGVVGSMASDFVLLRRR